jgi:hypothetical protein
VEESIKMNRDNYRKIVSFRSYRGFLSTTPKIAKKLYEEKAIPLSPSELWAKNEKQHECLFADALMEVVRNQNDRTFHLFHEALREFDPNWAYVLDLSAEEIEIEHTRLNTRLLRE